MKKIINIFKLILSKALAKKTDEVKLCCSMRKVRKLVGKQKGLTQPSLALGERIEYIMSLKIRIGKI